MGEQAHNKIVLNNEFWWMMSNSKSLTHDELNWSPGEKLTQQKCNHLIKKVSKSINDLVNDGTEFNFIAVSQLLNSKDLNHEKSKAFYLGVLGYLKDYADFEDNQSEIIRIIDALVNSRLDCAQKDYLNEKNQSLKIYHNKKSYDSHLSFVRSLSMDLRLSPTLNNFESITTKITNIFSDNGVNFNQCESIDDIPVETVKEIESYCGKDISDVLEWIHISGTYFNINKKLDDRNKILLNKFNEIGGEKYINGDILSKNANIIDNYSFYESYNDKRKDYNSSDAAILDTPSVEKQIKYSKNREDGRDIVSELYENYDYLNLREVTFKQKLKHIAQNIGDNVLDSLNDTPFDDLLPKSSRLLGTTIYRVEFTDPDDPNEYDILTPVFNIRNPKAGSSNLLGKGIYFTSESYQDKRMYKVAALKAMELKIQKPYIKDPLNADPAQVREFIYGSAQALLDAGYPADNISCARRYRGILKKAIKEHKLKDELVMEKNAGLLDSENLTHDVEIKKDQIGDGLGDDLSVNPTDSNNNDIDSTSNLSEIPSDLNNNEVETNKLANQSNYVQTDFTSDEPPKEFLDFINSIPPNDDIQNIDPDENVYMMQEEQYDLPPKQDFPQPHAIQPQQDLPAPHAVPQQQDLPESHAVPPQQDLPQPHAVPPQQDLPEPHAVQLQQNNENTESDYREYLRLNMDTPPDSDNSNQSYIDDSLELPTEQILIGDDVPGIKKIDRKSPERLSLRIKDEQKLIPQNSINITPSSK
ncbi:hypothetical protein [Photobacterium leiognathi]|uniref:hypothetical protein n=1 Tax=Photobacterium leiognathi TaxID=553611 RepID=UPI0029810FC6|nr:hypothetical protein [Photobacterium leiognathi]